MFLWSHLAFAPQTQSRILYLPLSRLALVGEQLSAALWKRCIWMVLGPCAIASILGVGCGVLAAVYEKSPQPTSSASKIRMEVFRRIRVGADVSGWFVGRRVLVGLFVVGCVGVRVGDLEVGARVVGPVGLRLGVIDTGELVRRKLGGFVLHCLVGYFVDCRCRADGA